MRGLFADSSENGRRKRTLSAFLWWTVLCLVVKKSSRAGVENPKIGLSAAIFDRLHAIDLETSRLLIIRRTLILDTNLTAFGLYACWRDFHRERSGKDCDEKTKTWNKCCSLISSNMSELAHDSYVQ